MKTKMKIRDVIQLNSELHLLHTEDALSFVVKYDVKKLLDKTKVIVKDFTDQQQALFKKYGVCTDEKKDTYSLEGSDDYVIGLKEINDLLDKEETFDKTFKLNDFKDLKTANPYIQLMNFIEEPSKQEEKPVKNIKKA